MTHTDLIALLSLREGLRLLGNLEGESPDRLYILEAEQSGTLYGLKLLPRPLTSEAMVVEALVEHVREASRLDHPNVAATHLLGFAKDQPYVISEFVPGESLASLARRDALTLRGLFNVAYLSTTALYAAHGAAVTHQNIGPEKIIITPGHGLKLVDFGVGRYKRLMHSLAGPRPGFIEFLREGSEVKAARDLSALGRALYFAATGQFPPAGEGASSVPPLLARQRRESRQLPPTLSLARWQAERLGRTIDSLLAPEPQESPNVSELLREMRHIRNVKTKLFMDYGSRTHLERARGDSADDDFEPVAVRRGREVNAWIVDGELPLIRGRQYKVGVNIGAPREGRLAGWPFAEPDWGDRSEIRLLLSLHAAGVDVSPSYRRTVLHREKNMRVVYFRITPRVAGPVSLHLSIFLARELTLLEEFRVGVVVADAAEVEDAA